ncbi:MAG: hypothetical protein ACKVY0_27230 [Prosthecobacter sp.]|uniref:hypothetical protein n=1 Tax=Prosthecobacter sp. TaxID=1965333 RepID=UPI0038FF809A
MIAERLPALAAMSLEEKWEVYRELDEELHQQADTGDDPQLHDPATVAAVKELLESRLSHYHAHPETARPWEEVRASLKQRFDAWKTDRRKTA